MTAAASTCAASWRMTSSAPGVLAVMISSGSPAHERAREVAHLAVLAHGERGAREARADRRGGVGAGRAVGELELGAVGKGDVHAATHCAQPRRQSRSHAVRRATCRFVRARTERPFGFGC